MKVYSDVLTTDDLHAALPQGVWLETFGIGKPRVRRKGWTVRLGAISGRRWMNSGTHGAGPERAASWDQHGEWMSRLFKVDPGARIAEYDGAEHFHRSTEGKYRKAADRV